MPPRRDPLAHLKSTPQGTVETIAIAKKRKHERGWEKVNRSHPYRGIPLSLRDEIKTIADSLVVPADEVARWFIEVGLRDHARGALPLEARPKSKRMTLFPSDGWPAWDERPAGDAWPKEIPLAKNGRSSQDNAAWKQVVSYRFPSNVHEQVVALAASLAVPVGDVMTTFLQYGRDKYKAGLIVPNPRPMTTRMTLT